MKVAISLPDALFDAAEELGEQLQLSRSELYARAIAEYLSRRQDAAVTQRLNAVYAQRAEGVEAAVMKAQLEVLGRETW